MAKDIQRTLWNQEQDALMLDLIKKWGEDNAKIAKVMGRSERAIKERRLLLNRNSQVLTVKTKYESTRVWRNRPEPSLELVKLQRENNRRLEEFKKRMTADFEPGTPAIW